MCETVSYPSHTELTRSILWLKKFCDLQPHQTSAHPRKRKHFPKNLSLLLNCSQWIILIREGYRQKGSCFLSQIPLFSQKSLTFPVLFLLFRGKVSKQLKIHDLKVVILKMFLIFFSLTAKTPQEIKRILVKWPQYLFAVLQAEGTSSWWIYLFCDQVLWWFTFVQNLLVNEFHICRFIRRIS